MLALHGRLWRNLVENCQTTCYILHSHGIRVRPVICSSLHSHMARYRETMEEELEPGIRFGRLCDT